MTREEEDAVLTQAEAITKQRNEAFRQQGETEQAHVDRLWKQPGITAAYDAKELRFAATARCAGCKAGLAYPLNIGVWGQWSCSAVLLKTAPEDSTAHDRLPFSSYEVKSEAQPSANGATTRPAAT